MTMPEVMTAWERQEAELVSAEARDAAGDNLGRPVRWRGILAVIVGRENGTYWLRLSEPEPLRDVIPQTREPGYMVTKGEFQWVLRARPDVFEWL